MFKFTLLKIKLKFICVLFDLGFKKINNYLVIVDELFISKIKLELKNNKKKM